MNTFQIGDIVVCNNPWLSGLLGFRGLPGILIYFGLHSSLIHLIITGEQITLMNEYLDKVSYKKENINLKVGDLVELKPKILGILRLDGVGIILEKTIITTNDFDGKSTEDKIDAFLVYFNDMNCEYTIPYSCLQVFSPPKTD